MWMEKECVEVTCVCVVCGRDSDCAVEKVRASESTCIGDICVNESKNTLKTMAYKHMHELSHQPFVTFVYGGL